MVTQTLEEKQASMSADIRLLGGMLGLIIQDQEGQAAFELVEEVRKAAIERRNNVEGAADALSDRIRETDLAGKRMLIKAFSNYFQLINIAEDQQRIRTLRRRERVSGVSDSIQRAIANLHQAGITAEQMRAMLDKIRVRLVLTAHPSEAKRQEILIKLRDIADMLTTRESSDPLPREMRRIDDDILRRVEQLWQTPPTRATRASVDDEVQFGLYFITSVIMNVVVQLYEELQYQLEQIYGGDWSDLPPVLRFASWIGGDRDGNPNVTPEVTERTVETLRREARRVYMADVAYLRDRLTESLSEVEEAAKLRDTWPEAASREHLYPGEIYRQVMDVIHTRLENNEYQYSEDLLRDLQTVAYSLKNRKSKHSARGTLGELIRKVALFGLHLVPLDIREDARLHTAALAEIFDHYGLEKPYAEHSEDEKQRLLTREIANPRPFFPLEPKFSEATNHIIETWRMIARVHAKYGPVVIDSAIASMSQLPSDVLAMLLFAKEVGVADDIDIVPLFETVDDLIAAPEVMTTLFNNTEYHKHLQCRQTRQGLLRQQIMIGYSDSNKDGGYIAANWSLYTAQDALASICQEHGVSLELFHGRGGSIGRGGGPTNRAIQSQPPNSLHGEIKITEQGEVIAYRYSNSAIAWRHLNQVIHAMMLVLGTPPQVTIRPEWVAAMDHLSESGRHAYRKFVYETEGFLTYWQQATPINELASMPIGSRPAKRKKGGFESIRAIPWVFSWMQSRAIIPSWYGVGCALEKYCQETPNGMETLTQMYHEWSFFNAMIENVELDVAKADMEIAALYAGLVEDPALRQDIYHQMKTEHERTHDYICRITGQENLLDRLDVIQKSIERRNPYVDPLNFIQVELLRELRKLDPESEAYKELLPEVLSSINGIAAGMKTTG